MLEGFAGLGVGVDPCGAVAGWEADGVGGAAAFAAGAVVGWGVAAVWARGWGLTR